MQDSKRDMDIKNRLLDSMGESEGGMIWENSIETCILPSVKEMTSSSSKHETVHSKPVHSDNPKGLLWREMGGDFGTRGYIYTHGWFMSMYGKSHHNVVK